MTRTDINLRRLAVVYLTAVHAGRVPTPVISAEFGIGRSSVSRRVREARTAGLLPAGTKGCATPTDGDHWPRMARLATGRAAWQVCLACHRPWPCPEAATIRWLDRIERTST